MRPGRRCALRNIPVANFLLLRRRPRQKEVNPAPFAFQLANGIGWIVYALILASINVQASIFLVIPNIVGVTCGTFYLFSCFPLTPAATRAQQAATMCFFAVLFPVIGAIGAMCHLSSANLQLLWGFTANIILVCFYTAPLSVLSKVIRTRCAASLNAPTACVQFLNASMWTGYGLALRDPFVWVTNACGAVSATVSIFLIVLFRNNEHSVTKLPDTDIESIGSLQDVDTELSEVDDIVLPRSPAQPSALSAVSTCAKTKTTVPKLPETPPFSPISPLAPVSPVFSDSSVSSRSASDVAVDIPPPVQKPILQQAAAVC